MQYQCQPVAALLWRSLFVLGRFLGRFGEAPAGIERLVIVHNSDAYRNRGIIYMISEAPREHFCAEQARPYRQEREHIIAAAVNWLALAFFDYLLRVTCKQREL